MKRSTLVRSGAAFASLAAVPLRGLAEAAADPFDPRPSGWRSFEVTTEVQLAQTGPSSAWLPLPSLRTDWVRPLGNTWSTNADVARVDRDPRSGAQMLTLQWHDPSATPVATVRSRVAAQDRYVDLSQPRPVAALSAAEYRRYTAATHEVPTDGIVKATADRITAGATTDLEKARRIYAWVVENTYRDPATRGCGTGDVVGMLESGKLGGKCADLNPLYIGLARASGIPGRDLYGIRVAPSRFGYHSLGASSAVITGAQHCRAEIFLADFGWVPVDPADVRKVILEEPPGHLATDDPKVVAARETLFGAWEGNWIPYNDGADVTLPAANEAPLAFLMYPQAQNDGVACDCYDPQAVAYRITAQPLT